MQMVEASFTKLVRAMTYLSEQYAGPSDFCHLHCHTIFSPLDGVATPSQYAERCAEYKQTAIAATEHGNMASVPDMYFACKKHSIRYLVGCEIYFNQYEPLRRQMLAEGTTRSIDKESLVAARFRRNRHLTVLCKNDIGFHNLIRLTTLAHQFGFHYNPRIWFDKLCEFKEGLIVLSGCLNGPLSYEYRLDLEAVAAGTKVDRQPGRDYTAVQYMKMFKQVFGDDFYIELQMPMLPEINDHKLFRLLLGLADYHKIRAVLTNDAHYIGRDDYYLQKVMMAVGQNTTIDNPDLFQVNSDEQFLKSRAELWATFKNGPYSAHISDAQFETLCDNTLRVADTCDPLKPDLSPKIPDWSQIEAGVDPDVELRRVVAEELKRRELHKVTKTYVVDGREVTYVEQAKIELNRFIDKGFASYFLITRDLLQFGRKHGWPFGPRGCTVPNSMVSVTVDRSKRIEDIQIGDVILDGFGTEQVVENKFVYDVSEELFVLELEDRTITITADHKLYVIRDGVVMLLSASEIKDTDEIIGSLPDQPATRLYEDSAGFF